MFNGLDTLFQNFDTNCFVGTLACENVERRRDESDFDLCILCAFGFCSTKCPLDGVDTFIVKTRYLDISTDLCRLWGKTFGDVGFELVSGGIGGKCDF